MKEMYPNTVVFSSDELRKELYGDETDQTHNEEVFKELHNRVKNALLSQEYGLVIYDACNINYKRRMEFLSQIRHIECKKIAVVIATPFMKCLQNDLNRERKVGNDVIYRMYKNIYVPQTFEGFDNVNIFYNNGYNNFLRFEELTDIEQDNPHHTLSVKNHCLKAYEYLKGHYPNTSQELQIATLYHDIGKLYTKTFKNAKGELTEVAHFYGHENASAYEAMFMQGVISSNDVLQVILYIQWHMIDFKGLSEKRDKHYTNLLGEENRKNIALLHEADINGG